MAGQEIDKETSINTAGTDWKQGVCVRMQILEYSTFWFLGLAGSHGAESESGTERETWGRRTLSWPDWAEHAMARLHVRICTRVLFPDR